MKPTDWRPYVQTHYRDALRCDTAGCGTRKPARVSPRGWSRQFDPKTGKTVHRCPKCTMEATA